MNFKTTVILIVLLAAAGTWLFFTHEPPPTQPQTSSDQGAKLIDVDSRNVTRVIVTPADGPEFTLEKDGADWQITEPTKAAADTFEVDSLIRAFTEAQTHGQIDPSGSNAAATGLDKPRYHVELVAGSQTVKLAIGDKSPVGDTLYVQIDGKSKADLVPSDLSDKLSKGVDAYRKMNLVSATSDQIKQISITTPQQTIVLEKQGSIWQMVSPEKMPADDSAASDLVFALTGLRADSFVDPKSVPSADISNAQLTVAFSTDAPITPPATEPATPPTWTTIQFGGYDDILKKNVYVTIAGSDAVAKVAATSLDQFRKKPLDLRDKKAVDLDPDQVSKIVLHTDLPSTTQPTTRPAENSTVVFERRKINPVLGPALATTGPATTKPTTEPELSKWIVSSDHDIAADDSKITTLLTALHPLRADQYLDLNSATQPAGNYTLTITTIAPGGAAVVEHHLALTDPGHDQPLIGYYEGLTFQTARSLTTNLTGPWTKP